MSGIFISYRRDDSQGFAGRLADDLGDLIGTERVFRDIEIPAGSEFGAILRRAIAACDVLLVVIGRRWLAPTTPGGRSRLFDPEDWVRIEIEAALHQHKRVVPVLVGDAKMPGAEELPDSIRRLSGFQAAVLSDRLWDAEVEALANRLRELSPSLQKGSTNNGRAANTLRDVLEELGESLAAELGKRRGPKLPPPDPRPSLLYRLFAPIGRGIKKLLSIAVVVALIYVGMRLFGDQELLNGLDTLEARLQIGWQRLQQYLN